MKKINIAMIALLAFGLVLASCGGEDATTPPAPAKQDTYTVMLYGVGDGTADNWGLDGELRDRLEALRVEGTNANVKFTAQINYSTARQTTADYIGTKRFHLPVGATAWTHEWQDGHALEKLYLPTTLASFITWSKATYPADKYILILDDHGGGWKPTEDYPKTASIAGDPAYGILFDTNYSGQSLSSFDLATAIKSSGTKLEMVFYSACYMNMLENLGELTDDVHYTYGANHITTNTIFDLVEFTKKLKQGGDIVTRMNEFAEYSIAAWNKEHTGDTDSIDIAFVDLTKLGGVFSAVKAAADFLTVDPNATVLGNIETWPIKRVKGTSNVDGVYFYDSFGVANPTPQQAEEFMFATSTSSSSTSAPRPLLATPRLPPSSPAWTPQDEPPSSQAASRRRCPSAQQRSA
jgi:hypothetical protein